MDLKKILKVSDSYQIPTKLMDIIYDKEEREKLFMRLLEENDYKLLLKNIDESLLTPLKYQYGKNLDYYTATIKLLDMW